MNEKKNEERVKWERCGKKQQEKKAKQQYF